MSSLKRLKEIKTFGLIRQFVTGLNLNQGVLERYKALCAFNHEKRVSYADEPALACISCGKNLLVPETDGIAVEWSMSLAAAHERHIEFLYWCCRGACDKRLKLKYGREGWIDVWDSLSDLITPRGYVRWMMAVLDQFYQGHTYSEHALQDLKWLILNLFPFVTCDLSEEEGQSVKVLMRSPGKITDAASMNDVTLHD